MPDPTPIRIETLLGEADWLHRLARAMLRDDDRAHDVAQETLVVALRHVGMPVANLRAWLQTIAQRVTTKLRRSERRRARREQSLPGTDRDEREATTAARLQLHHRLCAALLELPEPYRTAVSLRFFDDLPPRVIARQTNESAAVVRQRVHRGLAMLRERFDVEAGERKAWTVAFGALGLGQTTAAPVPVLATVFMMKKLLLAAALLGIGVWCLGAGSGWWQGAPPPDARTPIAAADPATSTSAAPATDAATAERSPATDAFRVRVVDAQDRGIAAAEVHRWRGDGEIEIVPTDDNGVAAFAARADAGGVLARHVGYQTVAQTLPALRGETTLRLGVGRIVAGRLFEDGAPTGAGLRLHLSVPQRREELPDAPAAIRDLLGGSNGGLSTVTDSHGDFRFVGLADPWAGRLQLPRTHWLLRTAGQIVEDDSGLLLTAPQDNLRVETTRLPTVRGRVEWSDGSGPVAGAFVLLNSITFADGTKTPSLGERTDEQGWFAIGLIPSAPDQHERWLDPRRRSEPTLVKVFASSGSSTNQTLEAGGGPLDLRAQVVLRLDRPTPRLFRAVDTAGNPLAGVRALQGDGTLSEPTGSDGLGALISPFGSWVGAPGRQVVEWPVPKGGREPAAEPHDVVLAEGNSLCIRARTANGIAAPSKVRLVGNRAVCSRMAGNLLTWLGESSRVMMDDAFYFDVRGEARMLSLVPGVSCRVVVLDHFGGELAAQEIVTPALGEQRVLDIVIDVAKYTARGRVFEPNGAPAACATVRLHTKMDGGGYSERTAADGSFQFPPMHVAGELVLTAHRQGFAATERSITAAERQQDLVLTLALARRTTVRIVDAAGVPVPEARLLVETGTSRRIDVQQIGSGEYVCFELPPGEVTFACWLAGARHELRHDTAKPSAELRVPRLARVHFERPTGWQDPPGSRLVAVAKRLDNIAEPLPVELDDDMRGVPQLLLPGHYRIELAQMRWNYEQQRSDFEPMGPTAEVELQPGVVVRVSFR